MKKPIKSRVVWMAAYPDGVLAVQIYGSSRKKTIASLLSYPEKWPALEKAGWRIVRVKISPVRR
jgi:hypothetical protein